MKKIIIYAGVSSILFIFSMCEDSMDNNDTYSLLNGNSFILEVDRVLKDVHNVQFPSDNLSEEDYVMTDDLVQYELAFSKDGQTVSVEPGSILGEKLIDGEKSVFYKLVEGVFAGGRIVIWKNDAGFEVEQTIYGSGVPIIKSERGSLELVTK
ncbi:MAG: hypothetical protein OEX02_09780 [Cyclobacteriaceae bacterium]|nr:hypothetical protein [Cyclobacteriaceae bacterium]